MNKKPYRDHLGNEYPSQRALAKAYGTTCKHIHGSLNRGMTLEQILVQSKKNKDALYPRNLIRCILYGCVLYEYEYTQGFTINYTPPNINKTLDSVMTTALEPIEIQVLELKYKSHLTYKQISEISDSLNLTQPLKNKADHKGLTISQVDGITKRAIRKLRQPKYLNLIKLEYEQ